MVRRSKSHHGKADIRDPSIMQTWHFLACPIFFEGVNLQFLVPRHAPAIPGAEKVKKKKKLK